MKKLIIFIILLAMSMAHAAEYELRYNYQDVILVIKEQATSDNRALQRAAPKCLDFYMDKFPNFSNQDGIEMIDVCANPNSRKEGWYE